MHLRRYYKDITWIFGKLCCQKPRQQGKKRKLTFSGAKGIFTLFYDSGGFAAEKRPDLKRYVRLTDDEAFSLYGTQIRKDFDENEIKPEWVIRTLQESGEYFCDVMCDGSGALLSYAFVLRHKDLFFLDYFATVENKRGCGFGTGMLSYLFGTYDGAWLLEVEDPERARDVREREAMMKRIRFYEHAGAARTVVQVTAFGHPYCLMVKGQDARDASAVTQQYLDVYRSIVGTNLSRVIRVID